MSKSKWILAGRRAVMAVRRLLRRDVGSWRPAVGKNCRRQIPLPAPCERRKIPLLDNLQICRDEFANYLTKRVLSPIDRANFGLLCDGFGESSLSSGRLVPSAGLTPRSIWPGVVDNDPDRRHGHLAVGRPEAARVARPRALPAAAPLILNPA